jgi:predicted secreted protein with PEFG-CTERM motif
MQNQLFVFTMILSALIVVPGTVYAEHIFADVDVFAESLDIVQLSSDKFTLTVDDISYDLYYGYHASFDSMASDELQPKLSIMSLNQERKSLEIIFDEVLEDSIFWVRMPDELISAEKGLFQVFVDGKETKYELIQFPNDMSLGIIMPQDGQHVEIIGTRVIPEFVMMVLPIFTISTILIIIMTRKYSTHIKF